LGEWARELPITDAKTNCGRCTGKRFADRFTQIAAEDNKKEVDRRGRGESISPKGLGALPGPETSRFPIGEWFNDSAINRPPAIRGPSFPHIP
jgi:hypothetical protein